MHKNYICHTGKSKQDVRCECGGQLMIGAFLHGLVDFGFGFVGNKFEVKRKYGKKVIGYQGFCLKCCKDGNFFFAGHEPPG